MKNKTSACSHTAVFSSVHISIQGPVTRNFSTFNSRTQYSVRKNISLSESFTVTESSPEPQLKDLL